jgi:hypothetical protein
LTKNLAFLEKYRYENEYDFYVRAIMADLKLANIPEYLLKKRIHPDQMSNFFESRVRNVEVMEIQKEYFLFLVKRLKFIDPRYLLFMIRHAWNRFSKKASFALRRLYLKKKELDFYAIPFDKCLHDNCDIRELNDKNILDIATVAFNNPEVIGWQIRLVRKNLADKKLYTVFDNSSDRRASERIRDLCADERVAYVRLPVNHLTRSSSHGSSFNWIYSNYFKKRMADYFGFLDHDIFPVKDTHLAPLLNRQPIYGHLQERRGLWYLWAGFCFFRSDHIKRKLNFLDGQIQGIGVDTGGMNWRPIYSKLNKGDLLFPKSRHEKIRESGNPSTKLYDTSLDMIEYVGDWIHLWGSSGYKTIRKKDERDEKIRSIINKLL